MLEISPRTLQRSLALPEEFQVKGVTTTLIGARTPAHIDNGLDALEMDLDAALRARMSAWA